MDEWGFDERINQGSRSNNIRADCVGNSLSLYVNGTMLVRVTDDTFSSGHVGLGAGALDKPGTDIRFTDFAVYVPKSPGLVGR